MDQNLLSTVSRDEDAVSDQEQLNPFHHKSGARPFSHRVQWLCHITITFSLSLIAASIFAYSFLTTHRNIQCLPGGFEQGHSTEFTPVLPYISVKVERPTGGFILSGNGTLEDTTSLYAGRPTPKIDQAWNQLLQGNEIVLPNDQAGSMKGKTVYDENGGGWRFGLEVYHGLHCINLLRKQVDASYYHTETEEKQHLDHCVDYLRQAVQCHSDLTPVRYWTEPESGARVVNFGEPHTCRDFDKIHQWVAPRYKPPPPGT